MPHTNIIPASATGVPSAAAAVGGELAGAPPVALSVHRNVLAQLDAANERIDNLLPANFELREMLGEATNTAIRSNERLQEAVITIEELTEKLEECKRELNAQRSPPYPDLSAQPGEPLRTYVWRCPNCGDPFNRDDTTVCQSCGSARPASTGGGRHTKKRRTRRRSRKGGAHDGPAMQAHFARQQLDKCIAKLGDTRDRLRRARNHIAQQAARLDAYAQRLNALQARHDECEAHRNAQRQTLLNWAQRIEKLQKDKRLLGIRLLRLRDNPGGGAGGGGAGGGGAGGVGLNGGGRHTKKRKNRRKTRRRRRKRRQRRTRRGGDSPLHIRRRLLALSTRIRQLKRRLWDKHRKARAKAKATAKESAFVHDPKSGHIVQRQNI